MINHFPTPLPDELFYSLCARYGERVQYSDIEAVNKELFGARGMSATIDLPSHLSHFVESLPPDHELTVDRLIDKHSLLPFYGPFLPLERYNRVRESMKGMDGSAIHKCAGITPSNVRLPNWLRYCPKCTATDKTTYGQSYWHRLHQVPSVMMCPIHEVFLENSPVRARNRINSALYITVEEALTQSPFRPSETPPFMHNVLIEIAWDVAWLLDQSSLSPGYELLRENYLALLYERKLAKRERIYSLELRERLRGSLPHGLLELLQCDFDAQKDHSWPCQIIKNLRQGKAHHPIRHLLLIRALGHSAESFFESLSNRPPKSKTNTKPFGNGPWLCLNPICPHFRKMEIRKIKIEESWKRDGISVATFLCECGFEYMRRGPDSSLDDRFRIDKVKTYGALWEAALKIRWDNHSLSSRQIASQLGVIHTTVKNHALRLGLPFPRSGPGPKVSQINSMLQEKMKRFQMNNSSTDFVELREVKRKAWLDARKNNPEANRTTLQRVIAPKIYYWLRNYDGEWLKAHLPSPFKRTTSARQIIDWRARDQNLEKEVRESAQRLKDAKGKPVKITVNAIGRDLDRKELLQKPRHLAKLPLTRRTLEDVIETRIQFAIRRVRWAAQCFRDEGIAPAKSILALRSCVGYEIWEDQTAGNVLKAEWRALQELSDQSNTRQAVA